jgi:hypothetical protein
LTGAQPRRLRVATRLLGLTLLLPACGADFLWVDTMGRDPELVTTTTTASTTTTTSPAPPPPPRPKPKLPPKPARPKPPPKPPPAPPQAKPIPLPGDSPLTGIGVGGYRTGHPALVVKLDNVGDARPQVGIVEADVVFEEQVEGGFTRFAAVYHSTASDPVGPIRSARSTDIALLAPLYHPLFSYSGANRDFKKLVRESDMIDVGVENFPGKYFRDNNGGGVKRSSVHNLFSNTSALHGLAAPDAQAPPPLFAYRHDGTRPSEPEARPVSRVQMTWSYKGKVRTTVSYDWDPGVRGWTRIQNGALHTDAAGRKVAPANVVVQFVTYHDTGYRDSSGAEVPEADVVGTGEGWYLSEGYLVPVIWEKRDADHVTTFRGKDGRHARLIPGRTWVELVPPGQGTATDRPADANDAAKPVAVPVPDGSGPTPGPEETTTTTTGPEESTTTTSTPEESTTSTTLPVTTSTIPNPIGDPPADSTTSTTTTTTSTGTESSSMAGGPASAALIGLLLLLAPPRRGRRRQR